MACLTRETAKRFKEALKSGEIEPGKMLIATSIERQAILSKIVGEENAGWVNAILESKIILKEQRKGMITWAKQVSGISNATRRDLISRIQKETKVFDPATGHTFLSDLAAKRFGNEITFEEAKNVSELARKEAELKAAAPYGAPRTKGKLDYGAAATTLEDYVNHLKVQSGKLKPLDYLKHPLETLHRSAGVAKSMLSTLDDSFFGRQGISILRDHPTIWFKNLAKSFGDIGKELIGRDAMFAIKSDVYSRDGALNGKYKNMGLDIHVGSEEAFPSHILGDVPGLGLFAKAAESAFNGAALRFRADLADWHIKNMERLGIDTSNPREMKAVGRFINSLSGRGDIGRFEAIGKPINNVIFSIKFLKSNWDKLTAHQFQKDVTPYVRVQALKSFARTIGSLATLYTIANWIKPGTVELDTNSSDFGTIKIGDTTFDPTGGLKSLVVLAARLTPQYRNGKLSWWTKNSKGQIVENGTDKFGSKNILDVLVDFTEGKFAPYAALFRDVARGKDFQGRRTYVEGKFGRPIPNLRTIYSAHAPIPAQNFEETMSNPNAAPLIWTTLADELGFSANTRTPRGSKGTAPPGGKSLGGKGLGGKKQP